MAKSGRLPCFNVTVAVGFGVRCWGVGAAHTVALLLHVFATGLSAWKAPTTTFRMDDGGCWSWGWEDGQRVGCDLILRLGDSAGRASAGNGPSLP